MRAVRHIVVVLIAFALVLVPAAGLAKLQAMPQEMSAGASQDACHCCDPAPASVADVCLLKCCNVAAVPVEAHAFSGVRIVSAADTTAAALTPFAQQPDLPPPRS
ncbi:MAG: hypothetical protein WAN86_00230 [Hyphomicrobiaceae bacterium]